MMREKKYFVIFLVILLTYGEDRPFYINSSVYNLRLTSEISSYSSTSEVIRPFHLIRHPVKESLDLCHNISSLLDYSMGECLGLSLQAHRTLRLLYFETFFQRYDIPLVHFSSLLSFSYGIETCDISETKQPIDVCFFGNTPVSVILMTILSCESYRVNVFHFTNSALSDMLSWFQNDFPYRSIRWIYGSYLSYNSLHSPPPHCNIIMIDEPSALELADIPNFPIPSPMLVHSINDTEFLLRPCLGNGLLIFYQPLSETTIGISHLTSTYRSRGVTINWRLTSISTTLSENVSPRDYEG